MRRGVVRVAGGVLGGVPVELEVDPLREEHGYAVDHRMPVALRAHQLGAFHGQGRAAAGAAQQIEDLRERRGAALGAPAGGQPVRGREPLRRPAPEGLLEALGADQLDAHEAAQDLVGQTLLGAVERRARAA